MLQRLFQHGGVAVVGLLLGLAGCDWAAQPAEEQPLVVETFLETGAPLPPLLLRQARSLSAPLDSLGKGVSAEAVTLTLGGTAHSYGEEAPGRYEPDTALVVPPQTPWHLAVNWQGETIRAAGITPSPIDIREVCVDVPETPSRAVQVDSLRRDSLDIPADQGYLYPVEVTVQWGQPPPPSGDSTTYWVRAQLRPDATSFSSEVVEFFLEPAQIQPEDQFPQRNDTTQWKGVYAVPVDSSDAPLPPHTLTTALVRGDSAFAAFAQTRTAPNRREPVSNVEGALGVALAVSVDSLTRVIEPGLKQCRTPS